MDQNLKMAPLVSVILPVYNGEKYIDAAVDSILKQTFVNFELIIINDGSTDKTLEILEQRKADSRIILLTRENKGLIYTLNEGIGMARGKYIARMDADDVSYSYRLEEQQALMEAEGLDICGGHYVIIDEDGNFFSHVIVPTKASTLKLYLSIMPPFAHGSVMFRKEFWDLHGLKYGSAYHEAEDYALWQEFFLKGARMGNVNEIIFKYRDHPSSFSYQKLRRMNKEGKTLRRKFILNAGIDYKALFSEIADAKRRSIQEQEFILLCSYLCLRYKKELSFFSLLKKTKLEAFIRAIFKIISGKI